MFTIAFHDCSNSNFGCGDNSSNVQICSLIIDSLKCIALNSVFVEVCQSVFDVVVMSAAPILQEGASEEKGEHARLVINPYSSHLQKRLF